MMDDKKIEEAAEEIYEDRFLLNGEVIYRAPADECLQHWIHSEADRPQDNCICENDRLER